MSVRFAWALLPALALLGGCVDDLPPAGHVVVYIDTDAPLPNAAGTLPALGAPAPLFDRVRVELFAPGASEPCHGCTREFDLDEGSVLAGASMVVVADDGAGTAPRARLRLFRGTPLDADPAPQATVELVVQLPEIPSEGGVVVTAFLPTDAVGVPMGSLDAPSAATRGWSGSGHPSTWKPAHRRPCTGQARPGEVCVPGGAYWMGNRTLVGLPDDTAANVERLVVVSPMWIDSAEVTVQQFREAMTLEFEDTETQGAMPWSGHYGASAFDSITDYCTLSPPDAVHDRLPVNCVWQGAAAAYCAGKGSRLPTEAELEFVAGDFSSLDHPWGADEPSCADAVWGRSNMIAEPPLTESPCLAPGDIALPIALFDESGAARPGRDRIELDDGTIYDLAASMSEWTSDFFNQPWEACWNREGSQVFVDPSCSTPGAQGPDARTLRGGWWYGPAFLTRAAVRFAGIEPGIQSGVRCVRSASEP